MKTNVQGSYKTVQDSCVGFENWRLVRTRLAPARDEQKVLFNGLVRTRLSGKLFVLCVQDPRTRLGRSFTQDPCAYKTLAQDCFRFLVFDD